MRVRRGRLIKLAILTSILLILYKGIRDNHEASSWQQSAVSPAKGANGPTRLLEKPRKVDLGTLVRHSNGTVRFHPWKDDSMVRYSREPTCKQKVRIREDVAPLVEMLSGSDLLDWIRTRIVNTWPHWQAAGQSILNSHHPVPRKKNILVVPGILRGTKYAKGSTIAAGGPLGELLQWADLIAGLYLLGHNITMETDYRVGGARLLELLDRDTNGCSGGYDIIYVDVLALEQMPQPVRTAFRCRFRVLDVYGTQAMYNDPEYSKAHSLKSNGGGLGLHLKQFFTFYPQTPDNSFLGFVVRPSQTNVTVQKENIGVLYGKDARYARGRSEFVSLLTKYMDVHYTMSDMLQIPTNGQLVNEGVLTGAQYGELLDRAKVFIGLGEPIEGTGAMEALAHGCVFINPVFSVQGQTNFMERKKPTQRLVTSQIPYLEHYIGLPHVYSIDVYETEKLVLAIQEILHRKEYMSLIPEEFSTSGYLIRLSSYIEYQDFCIHPSSPVWPPLSLLKVIVSDKGDSCESACRTQGLICEPMYFSHINRLLSFTRHKQNCSVVISGAEVIYPAIDTYDNVCWLQKDAILFSCATGADDFRRLCPCRSYKQHQLALWDSF